MKKKVSLEVILLISEKELRRMVLSLDKVVLLPVSVHTQLFQWAHGWVRPEG